MNEAAQGKVCVNIPGELTSMANAALANCVPNAGNIANPLFLASPTAVTDQTRSYDLLEPHTLVRRGVAVGNMPYLLLKPTV